MGNIINNFAEGSCRFEAGSSQNGDIHIAAPINQGLPCGAEQAGQQAGRDVGQMSNRQIVLTLVPLMRLTLDPQYTSHRALAIFFSKLTGRSAESFRKTIDKLAKEGLETAEARADARIAADALLPFCPDVAERIRNDTEE